MSLREDELNGHDLDPQPLEQIRIERLSYMEQIKIPSTITIKNGREEYHDEGRTLRNPQNQLNA